MTPAVRSAFLRLLGFESTTHAFPTLKGVYFKSSIAFELITTKGLRADVTWDSYSRQPAVAITLQLTNQVLPHKTNVHFLQTKLLIQALLKNNVLCWRGNCGLERIRDTARRCFWVLRDVSDMGGDALTRTIAKLCHARFVATFFCQTYLQPM